MKHFAAIYRDARTAPAQLGALALWTLTMGAVGYQTMGWFAGLITGLMLAGLPYCVASIYRLGRADEAEYCERHAAWERRG